MSTVVVPPAGEPQVDAAAFGRRYLIRFEEETLKQRPLWIRVIIEFVGTAALVLVAAGSGVINEYAGGGPISRTAAVVAPGAVVMAPGCRWQFPGVGQWCWICWNVMADAGTVPSSASVADADTWIDAPTANLAPAAGPFTVRTGGLFWVLIDSTAVPVAPS